MDSHTDAANEWLASQLAQVQAALQAETARRQRLEVALAKSEQNIRHAAQFPAENPHPVLRLSCEGTLTYANPASVPLLPGLGLEIGKPAPQFWRALAIQAFEQQTIQVIEVESDGRIFAFDVVPIVQAGYVNLYGSDVTVRRQAESQREAALEAARASEERFRSLADGLPQLVWEIDTRGTVLYANQAWLAYVGRVATTPGEQAELIHPEDRQRTVAAWQQAARTGSSFEGEYRLRRHDGEYRWFLERAVPRRVETGEIEAWIATAADIHDRKQAEQTLEQHVAARTAELQAEIGERQRAEADAKAERQRFNEILEILPAYLVLLTPDYRVPFANRFFRERFGESFGRRCYEYLFGRAEPCEICDTYRVLDTNAPRRWEWIGPDGHNYDVYDFPFADTDGTTLILEMGLDVTEQKQAEQALRAAGAYNRSLIEASLDPLVTIGPDGQITDANAATEATTGVPRAQLIGSDFSRYFTEPERASAGYRQVLAEGQVRDYPLTIRHAAGHTTDVLYNAAVYRNEAGVVQGVFAAARDITERQRAEAELEKYRSHLEELVRERTAELEAANTRLQAEIGERQRAEAQREAALAALERYLARLDQLLRVSQRVIAETTMDGLLQATVDAARELLNAGLATSGHGYRDGRFRVSAVSRAATLPPCPEGEVLAVERGGVYMEIITSARSFCLTEDQLLADPRWWGLPPDHVPLRGLVGAPLIGRDGRPVGLIMVSDREEGEFNAEDQGLLSQLAALASLAIQHVEAHAAAAEAAAAAEQRAAELDAVFTSIGSGLMFYGPDSRIARINPAAQAILGYSEPMQSLPFAEQARRMRIEGPDGRPMRFDQMPAARAFHGEIVQWQPMALYPAGPDRPPTWVMASAAPVRSAGGALLGVVSTFSDITELRRTQENLEAANSQLLAQAEELEVQSEELLIHNQELNRVMDNLEAERARLAAVLRRMPVGVAIAEAPSGRVVLYNEQMARLWRPPLPLAEGAAEWGAAEGYHPDGRPVAPAEWPLARALATGHTVPSQEYEIAREDGTRATMSIGATPILDRAGQVVAGVMVVHDVTEHRQLEKALRRASDELSTLLAISGDVASTLDVEALLLIVADRLNQIVPYTGLAVYRLAEDGRTLDVVAHRESDREQEVGLQPIPLEKSSGLKQIIRTGQPLLIPDLRSGSVDAREWMAQGHPVQRRLMGRSRCWLGVPLTVKDRVIGVLRLSHAEPGRFTAHDAELALAFARHVALAMENARLYEQAGEMAAVEERQRLARDLHDAVSQTLFSASLTADVLPRLWDQNPAQVRPLLEELSALTRGARAEMRTLLWELRPKTLLDANLEQLVEQLAEAMAARVRIQTRVSVAGKARLLPPDVQVGLYRIVQETLNNVIKHAVAEHASVCLAWLGPSPDSAAVDGGAGEPCTPGVELVIEDDGRGFDPQAVSSERLGLKIMRERAAAIGARVTVDSRPGSGTRVHVVWSE